MIKTISAIVLLIVSILLMTLTNLYILGGWLFVPAAIYLLYLIIKRITKIS